MKLKLEELLLKGKNFLETAPEMVLKEKASIGKWSKKEILGHLIDSAINNLKRFTEIQFERRPYLVRGYNQDELVKANYYQEAETKQLIALWLAINNQIVRVMELQNDETLSYEIVLESGERLDLRFLMEDYVNHLQHHLNQIMD